MNHVDLKYCGILATRIEGYTVKHTQPYRANMKCVICGDSQKSKTKKRGWILEKDNHGLYYCHNCGLSTSLSRFIKMIDENLYNEYIIDFKLENSFTTRSKAPATNIKSKPLDTLQERHPQYTKGSSPLLKIKKVSSLPANHPVKKYVAERKIPFNKHYKLYYAPKFNAWVNTMIPGKLPTDHDEPRLVIPFVDASGNLFGFAGRAFSKNSLRYITIMLTEAMPKIFGLDEVDFSKKYFVVEGQIDSLFLSNTVAMAGADGNVSGLDNIENAVFVFDNEPRNKEIVARMQKVLERGQKVCIWPDHLTFKDVNDMVIGGMNPAEVSLMIDKNTYSGLEGRLALTMWKRC